MSSDQLFIFKNQEFLQKKNQESALNVKEPALFKSLLFGGKYVNCKLDQAPNTF